MPESTTWLLGVIAAATAIMAIVQIGVIVFAARLASRVNRLADTVEHEIRPTLARVDRMSADLARVTSLASAQAERFDTIVGELATRMDEVVTNPVRQGGAFLVGLQAAVLAFRRPAGGSRPADADGRRAPDGTRPVR